MKQPSELTREQLVRMAEVVQDALWLRSDEMYDPDKQWDWEDIELIAQVADEYGMKPGRGEMNCARCGRRYSAGGDAYGELCPSCADETEPTHRQGCAAVRQRGARCDCDREGEFVAIDDEQWL